MIGSPPHTREHWSPADYAAAWRGITPAYAGTLGCRCGRGRLLWDHPRIRGNTSTGETVVNYHLGSPPHTREHCKTGAIAKADIGITPAYAGTLVSASGGTINLRDHPRIRGNTFAAVFAVF